MKVLIVFLHPAPYKVKIFNELAKYCDLFVLFERKASNRNNSFYNEKIHFKYDFAKGINIGKENFISNNIAKYIKNHHNEYDVIIMNGYSSFAEMKAIRYLKHKNITYNFMINGGVIRKEPLFKKLLKQYYIQGADKYLYSTSDGLQYLSHYGIDKAKCHFYHYSNISLEQKIENKKITIPFTNHLPLFLSVGQFIKRKNNFQLIKIFENMPYNLLFIGEGKQKNKMEKYIKKRHILNILIHDYVKNDDLHSYYKISSAYISLSKEDIFGHTIIEALSNNIPVVSSNGISISKDIIKNDINGYLVDINNDDEIITAINKATLLKKEGINDYVKKYNCSQSAKDIYNIIQ